MIPVPAQMLMVMPLDTMTIQILKYQSNPSIRSIKKCVNVRSFQGTYIDKTCFI